jgi:death-on-curing protein
MSTPAWVTVDEVIELNKHAVNRTQEPFGLVHPGSLGSAVARPEQHFSYGPTDTHDDLVLLGTKLCIGISESQAFIQGNKRTGFAAMEMFFNHNGFTVSTAAVDRVAALIIGAAHPNHAYRLSDDEFAYELDPFVVEASDVTTGGLLSLNMNMIETAMRNANLTMHALATMPVDIFHMDILKIGLLSPPTLNEEDDDPR